ncbi:hypothetical protein [Chroococcidiopsis sp.]|uniref:hypothetical protein n=1 Tax=Chroococcidiopsis sp. TaxID=3088168 RepID=UPI003F2A1B2A
MNRRTGQGEQGRQESRGAEGLQVQRSRESNSKFKIHALIPNSEFSLHPTPYTLHPFFTDN